MAKKYGLMIVLLASYFLVGTIMYPIIIVNLEDFHVLATLYILRTVLHLFFIALSLLCAIIQYHLKTQGLAIMMAILILIAGAFIYPTYLVLVPIAYYGLKKKAPFTK